ncbi:unnamed protein product [Heterobilharzia americana]|nr:unnamed protein product [Heterobilharzia americana]CAH8641594.1 unnamed protein product [Heterobilharzia americana]
MISRFLENRKEAAKTKKENANEVHPCEKLTCTEASDIHYLYVLCTWILFMQVSQLVNI